MISEEGKVEGRREKFDEVGYVRRVRTWKKTAKMDYLARLGFWDASKII